ncbi:biotin/lipoyl-containing protein [Thermodesulfobacteriota bacterium]
MDKKTQYLIIDDTKYETEVPDGYIRKGESDSIDPKEIRSIIPGIIADIKVKKGQKISAGDVLIVLEAMKMYNEIEAKVKGKVEEVNVKKGDRVSKGKVMIRLA